MLLIQRQLQQAAMVVLVVVIYLVQEDVIVAVWGHVQLLVCMIAIKHVVKPV